MRSGSTPDDDGRHRATRAGVSIGAVYRFFENRDAIVATLAARWRERIQEAAAPVFSDESLRRDAVAVITDFLSGFRQALDQLPGGRGMLAAVATEASLQEAVPWTSHLDRFIQRYAPGLRPARRRHATRAYQSITITLMIGAADAGRHITPLLNETRSVLLGYTNQLAAEAAAEAGRTLGKTRPAPTLTGQAGMYLPPSTTSTWPVTKRASSVAKNTAAPVRSSAWSTPGTACCSASVSSIGWGTTFKVASVAMTPGAMQLTVMFQRPSARGKLGQADDAPLRLLIVEHVEPVEHLGADRRTVVVRRRRGLFTMRPYCLLDHLRRDRMRHEPHAVQVHVEDSLEVVEALVPHVPIAVQRGVVHQNVNATEPLDEYRERTTRLNSGRRRRSARTPPRPSSRRLGAGSRPALIVDVGDRHGRAFTQKPLRVGAANAAAPTRHDSDPVS